MKTLLASFVLLFCINVALAQNPVAKPIADTTTITSSIVKLKDGTSLRGKIMSNTNGNLTIQTDNLGEVNVPLSNVDSIEEVRGSYNKSGSFWFDNTHASRYFWAPSAINLHKGEAYYQNAYVFLNSVTYGVTDDFTMGGGFVLNPYFKDWQALFVTPKYSRQVTPKLRLGVGAIGFAYIFNEYNYNVNPTSPTKTIATNSFGILYANGTYGSLNDNFSLGLGWAYGNRDIRSTPVLNISFMKRLGKNFSLVSENWLTTFDNTSGGIFSGGVRIFGERMAVDLALWTPVSFGNSDSLYPIPYIDFVYKFGKRKK
jgi:hypothetical protein